MRRWLDRIVGVRFPDNDATRRAQTLVAFMLASIPVALVTAVIVLPYDRGPESAFFLVLTAVLFALLVWLVHRGLLAIATVAFGFLLLMVTVGQPLATQDMSTNAIIIPLATLMLLYVVPLRRWYLVLLWVLAAMVILMVGTTDAATVQVPRFVWLLNVAMATVLTVIVVMYAARQLTDSVRREESLSHELSAQEAVQQRLRELANSDPLTGFLNRRSMVEVLDRAGPVCAFAVIDLDNFKTINDRFSHSVGDDVLVAFSSRVAELADPHDLLFRLGGDEFLVARPEARATDLGAWLHALRDALRADPAPIPMASFSAGVVDRTAAGVDMALRRADDALYVAKAQGRDVIVVVD